MWCSREKRVGRRGACVCSFCRRLIFEIPFVRGRALAYRNNSRAIVVGYGGERYPVISRWRRCIVTTPSSLQQPALVVLEWYVVLSPVRTRAIGRRMCKISYYLFARMPKYYGVGRWCLPPAGTTTAASRQVTAAAYWCTAVVPSLACACVCV